MKLYCLYCNDEIYSSNDNRKYCSKSCGLKHRAQINHDLLYEDRLCLICNKEFHIRKKSKKKTCSRECGYKSSSKQKKAVTVNCVCKVCGEIFNKKIKSKRTTCSRKCGIKRSWYKSPISDKRRTENAERMKSVGEENKNKEPWNKGLKGSQEAWNKRERITFKCKICHRDYETYLKEGNPRRITCGSNYCKQAKIPLFIDHNVDVDNWTEPIQKLRCKICAKEFEVRLGRSGRIKSYNNSRGHGKKKLYTCSEECFDVLRCKLFMESGGKGSDTKPELEMESFLKENEIRHRKQYWQRDGKRIVFYDFILWDYNILLEVDGDYWHANPKFYQTMNEAQRKVTTNDKYKEKLAKERGFIIFRAWQSELEERKQDLLTLLSDLEKEKE